MFLASARKLNLENFRDIPLRPCGTSSYSSEIAEVFITVKVLISFLPLVSGSDQFPASGFRF